MQLFHISDIHIREGHRESEINIPASFGQLVVDIERVGVDNAMLVIAGDVFENKSKFTTREIDTFMQMLELLEARHVYTIIIPGNHDYNINSAALECGLALFVGQQTRRDIYCIIESGVHTHRGIDFYVFSPIDQQIPLLQPSPRPKVAILHETISGAVFDSGTVAGNAGGSATRFNIASFVNFDMVLLGDIHKPQFLAPNIAYCGSFVQKNKGEGLDHGYIQWDIKKRTGRHVFIPLRQLYLKIFAAEDVLVGPLPTITAEQKVVWIGINHTKCTAAYINALMERLSTKYDCATVQVIDRTKPSSVDLSVVDGAVEPEEVDQICLIRDALLHSGETAETIQQFAEYHAAKLQGATGRRRCAYRLNYLSWDNVMCYGLGNYIDFRGFKRNLVLLNGKNKQGKSSVLDILIRVLFNENWRGMSNDIIRTGQKYGRIVVSFSVGADEYVIEQMIRPKKTDAAVSKNGENIMRDNITDTYKMLRDEVGLGDFKDFLNITVAVQNRSYLVDMPKKDLLAVMTKITDIDDLLAIGQQAQKDYVAARTRAKTQADQLDRFGPIDDVCALTDRREECRRILEKLEHERLELEASRGTVHTAYDPHATQKIEALRAKLSGYSARDIKHARDSITEANYAAIKDRAAVLRAQIPADYKARTISQPTALPTKSVEYLRGALEMYGNIDAAEIAMLRRALGSWKPVADVSISAAVPAAPVDVPMTINADITRLTTQLTGFVVCSDAPALEDLQAEIKVRGLQGADLRALAVAARADTTAIVDAGSIGPLESYQHALDAANKAAGGVPDRPDEAIKKLEAAARRIPALHRKIQRLGGAMAAPALLKYLATIPVYDEQVAFAVVRMRRLLQGGDDADSRVAIRLSAELEDAELAARKLQEYRAVLAARAALEKAKAHYAAVAAKKAAADLAVLREFNKWHSYYDKLADSERLAALLRIRELAHARLRYLEAHEELRASYDAAVRYAEAKKTARTHELYVQYSKLAAAIEEYEDAQELASMEAGHESWRAIRECKARLERNHAAKAVANGRLIDVERLLATAQERTRTRDKMMAELREAEYTMNFLDRYRKLTGTEGIYTVLLVGLMDRLTERCNAILTQIADFTVLFKYMTKSRGDDKVGVHIYTIGPSGKVPAYMASGAQKFMIDLVLRIALNSMSTLSTCNMLFIDEGFGALDAGNFDTVADTLCKLKDRMDAIVLITHLDGLKRYTDAIITIDVAGSVSTIQHGGNSGSVYAAAPIMLPPVQAKKEVSLRELFCITDTKAQCTVCQRTVQATDARMRAHMRANYKEHKAWLVGHTISS